MALTTNDFIPAPVARTFDNSKPNPNAVVLKTHGPRAAKFQKVSKVFWERNTGSDDKPNYVQARKGEAGAIPRIRVYVTFDKVKNADGQPLTLSTKMRASTAPKATFAIFLASLAGITPDEVDAANLDIESFYGAPVLATTKAGRDNMAILTSVTAAPRDEDEDADVTPAAIAPHAADEDESDDVDDAEVEALLDDYHAN